MVHLSPMLAVAGRIADVRGDGWSHEFKWDGIRVLLEAEGPDESHHLWTRNGNDVAVAWPELAPLAARLPAGTVVDGEVVVLDEHQRPSFSRVAARMHVRNPVRVRVLQSSHPGRLMAFDLLRVGGQWLVDEPLEERRRRLAEVLPPGSAWAVPPASEDLEAMLAVVRDRGFEGIVSKRHGSAYEPGVRSRHWRKLRMVREIDAVVVGYRGVDGVTVGPVGSLALARWDPDVGAWRPLGSAGSGLTEREGRRLRRLLDEPDAPVDDTVATIVPADFVPVRPAVVVRVSYLEATPQGQLRHPVYKGQRTDVAPTDVTDLP